MKDYSQSGQGVLGLGVLSGEMLGGNDIVDSVTENMRFRVNSARDMFTGQSEMAPLQRRQEIIDRQMNTLDSIIGGDNSRSSSSSRQTRSRSTASNGSGSISGSGSRSASTSSSTPSPTPSMSEVDRGTKSRAQERGFGT